MTRTRTQEWGWFDVSVARYRLAYQNQRVSKSTRVKLQRNGHSRSALIFVLKVAKSPLFWKTFFKSQSLVGYWYDYKVELDDQSMARHSKLVTFYQAFRKVSHLRHLITTDVLLRLYAQAPGMGLGWSTCSSSPKARVKRGLGLPRECTCNLPQLSC